MRPLKANSNKIITIYIIANLDLITIKSKDAIIGDRSSTMNPIN